MSSLRSWECGSARWRLRLSSGRALLLADREALLRPRHGLGRGSHCLTQRDEVAGYLVDLALERVAAAGTLEARVERPDPLLHPVEQVLDRLEPLGQRAEPPSDPLHVSRG